MSNPIESIKSFFGMTLGDSWSINVYLFDDQTFEVVACHTNTSTVIRWYLDRADLILAENKGQRELVTFLYSKFNSIETLEPVKQLRTELRKSIERLQAYKEAHFNLKQLVTYMNKVNNDCDVPLPECCEVEK